MKYTINTTPLENGIIEQELYRKTPTCEERVMRWVVDTREDGIRKALVDLGWTPPELSSCCKSHVTVEGSVTHWHKCTKCGNPCDVGGRDEAA